MNGLSQMLLWGAALLTYPLFASDTRSAAWAFCLGAELAIGLTSFLLILTMAVR